MLPPDQTLVPQPPVVSADELRTELLQRRYAELLAQPEIFPSQANWDFIIGHALTGIGWALYRKFLVSAVLPEEERRAPNRLALIEFPRYLKSIPRHYAVELVYDDTVSAPEATYRLICDCELFDAPSLAGLIERGEVSLAADLLEAFQPAYSREDLREMRRLSRLLHALPEEGEMADGRGLLRKELRYICPRGHANAAEAEYCTHSGCGLNIYGLTREQTQRIDSFDERIDALAALIDEKESYMS